MIIKRYKDNQVMKMKYVEVAKTLKIYQDIRKYLSIA